MTDTNKSAAFKSVLGGKPAPLGRGLSALFGDSDAGYQPPAAVAGTSAHPAAERGGPKQLPVSWLQPGKYQPRQTFDDPALEELAASIREHGVLQPLLVRPLAERDRYEIIAGERRWRASQRAGIHEVPVVIRELSDADALEIALIENLQREDLSPLEEAEAFERLMREFNHTQVDLAKALGKSHSYVANSVRLLNLPDSIKKLVREGTLSAAHGRTLLGADNADALAAEVIRTRMTVRELENRVRKPDTEVRGYSRRSNSSPVDANTLALEKDLTNALGLKVKLVTYSDGSGSITVNYRNLDQFEDIVQKLRAS